MRGIAISGRAGAGKSTLAAELEQSGFTRIAFADALKQEVRELFGLEKHHPGGREKLIEWGNGRRDENPYYWVTRFHARARWAKLCGVPVVCDDLRFEREFHYLRAAGYVLVRIEASASLRAARLSFQGLAGGHAWGTDPGETELEGITDWDVVVQNEGGSALREAAEALRDHARGLAPLPGEVAASYAALASAP